MESKESKELWKQMSCLDEQISLKLPMDWSEASEEVIMKRFPYNLYPQKIYVNSEENRIFTLEIMEKRLHEKQSYLVIREIQRLINRIYPESIHETAKTFRINEENVGLFVYVTGAVDGEIAHCMFVMAVNGNMMLGGYHYPAKNMSEEQGTVLNILKSIQIRKIKEDILLNHARNRVYG